MQLTYSTIFILFLAISFAIISPDLAQIALKKEGLIEQISNLILLGGILLWYRERKRSKLHRTVPTLVMTYLALLLLEEIDWGGIYGFHLFQWIFGDLGRENLHNFWNGMSYALFGIPILLWFYSPAFSPARQIAGWFAPYSPNRDARIALLIVILSDLMFTITPWESLAQELAELLIYMLLISPCFERYRELPQGTGTSGQQGSLLPRKITFVASQMDTIRSPLLHFVGVGYAHEVFVLRPVFEERTP